MNKSVNAFQALVGILTICGLWAAATTGWAQNTKATISGYIKDKTTGEALIGATVLAPELKTGANTNEYGFFSLTLPTGRVVVQVSYSGYKTISDTLNLTANRKFSVELEEDIVVTEEVVVKAEGQTENVTSLNMSTVKLDVKTVQQLPALFGETDVLKTIQLLPGIQTAGEGTTGFFVRGGGADQNLIQLDEAIVYNASHLLGFFSVFNSDAVKDVEIFKGGIPARYGGRLSSIIDIRMKEGNTKRFGMSGGIGTISSRLTVEAPIVKDKGSFIVSGRRTYADVFLNFSNDPVVRDSRLYFYDLNFKANYTLGDRDRIYASGYFGRDVFGNGNLFGLEWGNATGTVRWNHLFSDKLFSNLTLIVSDFDYSVSFSNGDQNAGAYNSGIRDYGLKYDFSYYPSNTSKLYFGLQSTWHSFQPGYFKPGNDSSFFIEFGLPREYSLESAVYAEHEWNPSSRWGFRYGVRLSGFAAMGPKNYYTYVPGTQQRVDTTTYGSGEVAAFYPGFEPRLSVKYQLTDLSSLKASYNRTFQYVHQLSNATSSRPFDLWVASNRDIKPQILDQWALGYFQNFFKGKLETSVEVFYKQMYNQIDFKDYAELFLNQDLVTQLLFGKGWAYGAEFYIRKTTGKLTGWVSYTLARVERQVPGVNNGEVYSAVNDRRHNLAVVLMYDFSKRVNLGANFVYLTGNAVTIPSGGYIVDGRVLPFFNERNGGRWPDTHRLDVALTVKLGKLERRYKHNLNFSVYNIYGQKNPWAIAFREKEGEPGKTEAVKTYLFRWIPSISYNFEF